MASAGKVRPDLLEAGDFPVPFGRYNLLGVLGEGGMARVFRAELQGLRGFRKRAAVKVIRASIGSQDERLTQALIHEAKLGGLLHHPNVVETYDFGEVDGQAWIAMELVSGIGLDRLLETREALPPDVALEIAAQICAGLTHAHELGGEGQRTPLVHRDLKPSNVIVSNSGLVKVLDFGIAKATHIGGNTTETGLTKGTPAYMSPEQAAGQPVDARSDLFAAGCLLYEMLTGKCFFGGDTVYQIMMSVVRVEELLLEQDRLDAVDAAVPGASEVVRRCMRAERDNRFDTALELEAAVRAMQGPVQAPGPIKRWIDEARAAGDPRFTDAVLTPKGGPTQLRVTDDLEELSLELVASQAAQAALRSAPTRVVSATGSAPLTAPPVGPTRAMPPTPALPPHPVEATLGATRQVPPQPRTDRLMLAGMALGILGIVALAVAFLMIRGSEDGDGVVDGPVDVDVVELIGEDPDKPNDEGDPLADLQTPPASARTERSVPAKAEPAATPLPVREPAADPTPLPAREPTPKPRVEARPTPRPTPKPRAAARVSAKLEHSGPSTVVIGTPTRLSVKVDPPGACTPKLAYAPWDLADGGWKTQRMAGTGGGHFEAELFLPYEVAWRSGFRYQLRCDAKGERVATWPDSGSKKVPSLAR